MRKKEKIIGSVTITIICILFVVVGYLKSPSDNIEGNRVDDIFVDDDKNTQKSLQGVVESKDGNQNINNNNIQSDVSVINVEIKGEVKKPDVYKIKSGSIVNDLIDMAGGTSINADMSSINRAAKLSDNQCIVIPKKGEKTTNAVNNPQVFPSSSSNSDEIQDKSVVNINTASKEELEKLPGIGATKAQRIIDYRVQKGAFKNIESIQNVSGIGEQTFENIKERITVQ